MGQKYKRFREFRTPFPLRDIRKNPRSLYARVPQAMAQFFLKIEKLSHIMGPTPILEMERAYGLRPQLWLLIIFNFCRWTGVKAKCKLKKKTNRSRLSIFFFYKPTCLQKHIFTNDLYYPSGYFPLTGTMGRQCLSSNEYLPDMYMLLLYVQSTVNVVNKAFTNL